jgi:hypothetical protein
MEPKLQYLSQGAAVMDVQSKLNSLLPQAVPLRIDGIFGDKTLARVKEFQRSRGLTVDGVVGPKTWAALGGAPPPKPGSPPPPPSGAPLEHKVKANVWAGVRVHHGAALRCSKGKGTSVLLLDDPGRIATTDDCAPYKNILPFGACTSYTNPSVETWSNPFEGESLPVLSVIPGLCLPGMCGYWSAGKPILRVDGGEALDKGSSIICRYGGHITFL